MKKKILIIINPYSGIGKHEQAEQAAREYLDTSLFEYKIISTETPEQAYEYSKEAVENAYDVVATAGGDGSIHQVGKALIGSNTLLGIIPAGSGNGLALHLKIPKKFSEAVKVINRLNTRTIDTAVVTPDSLSGKSEIFVATAGVGFDAHIANEFSKFGRRGIISYIRVSLREYLRYKVKEYELDIPVGMENGDDKTIIRKAFFIAIANSSQYGNNAEVAPKATIDDGYVNISILKKFPPDRKSVV